MSKSVHGFQFQRHKKFPFSLPNGKFYGAIKSEPVNRFWRVRPFFHSKLNFQKLCKCTVPGILTGSQKSGSRLQKIEPVMVYCPGFFPAGHTPSYHPYGQVCWGICHTSGTFCCILRVFQKKCDQLACNKRQLGQNTKSEPYNTKILALTHYFRVTL